MSIPRRRRRRRSAARSPTASSPCRCSARWRPASCWSRRRSGWASITASSRSASSPRSAPASRVRGRFTLISSVEEKRPGQWQFLHAVTVEIEGEDKPALIADWIGMIFVMSAGEGVDLPSPFPPASGRGRRSKDQSWPPAKPSSSPPPARRSARPIAARSTPPPPPPSPRTRSAPRSSAPESIRPRSTTCIIGAALQQGVQATIGRTAALARRPARHRRRACRSTGNARPGLMAIATAAKQIIVDRMDVVVAGGVESISTGPDAGDAARRRSRAARDAQGRLHADDPDRRGGRQALRGSAASGRTPMPCTRSSAPPPPRPRGRFDDEIVPVTATMKVTDKATGETSNEGGHARPRTRAIAPTRRSRACARCSR